MSSRGAVEADDVPDDVEAYCRGLDAQDAVARLGGTLGPREALGYWVGAIREAFEEVGVLLAYGADGGFASITDDNRGRFEAYRAACQVDNRAFFDMLRAERLTLATDRLGYFAHWITPEENPIRFDTRFFAAVIPPGQDPVADGHEIVDVRWLTPEETLEAIGRREIRFETPTIKNLEIVGAAASAGGGAVAAVAAVGRREVPTIRPRVLTVDSRPSSGPPRRSPLVLTGAARQPRPSPGFGAFTRTAILPYGCLLSSIDWWQFGMSSKR